jgi:integrase/recombinase XerD
VLKDGILPYRRLSCWELRQYHGIRREELCGLRVKDLQSRQGVMHFRIKGKRDKIRFVPVNAAAQRLIEDYLALTGHRTDMQGVLFRPVKNNRTGRLDRHLDRKRSVNPI